MEIPARRRPLQPVNSAENSPAVVSACLAKPKQIRLRPEASAGTWIAGKENCPPTETPEEAKAELLPREASLAEELEAARRVQERVSLERERTERALKEKAAALEKWMAEMERRWEEQRNLELELRLLMKLKDLRSDDMVLSPVFSLRQREERKRARESTFEESHCEAHSDGTAESSSVGEAEINFFFFK